MVMTVKHVVPGDGGYEALHEATFLVYDIGGGTLILNRPTDSITEDAELALTTGYAYVLNAAGRVLMRYTLGGPPGDPDDQPFVPDDEVVPDGEMQFWKDRAKTLGLDKATPEPDAKQPRVLQEFEQVPNGIDRQLLMGNQDIPPMTPEERSRQYYKGVM